MLKLFLILHLTLVLPNCNGFVIDDYDLDNPNRIIELPKRLKEVSGLSYADNQIYAVQDEKGNIYQVDLKDESIIKYDFAKDGDYEGIEGVDSLIFTLTSKGELYRIKIYTEDSVQTTKLDRFVSKDKNLEGIAYDKIMHRLLIASKPRNTGQDKIIYAYDLNNIKPVESLFSIDIDLINKKLGTNSSEFNPSALAIHPLTQELYILSHPNQQLLVMDLEKESVLKLVKLNKNLFLQPEGICFDEQGTLYISSEGKDEIPGKIFIFKAKKKKS